MADTSVASCPTRSTGQAGHGQSNPVYFVVHRWLATLVQGKHVATSSVIVSVHDLPTSHTRSDSLKVTNNSEPAIDIKMSATRIGRGAGGRTPSDRKELPEVCKKGPDRWVVSVEVAAVHHRCLGNYSMRAVVHWCCA